MERWSTVRHGKIVEEMEDQVDGLTDEVIHVALGTNMDEERKNLFWVFNNFPGSKVIILHVHWPSELHIHWPSEKIGTLGDEFGKAYGSIEQLQIHRKQEKWWMNNLINQYIDDCHQSKVQVEALVLMNKDPFDGIQELVRLCQVKRLVIGSRFMAGQESLLNCCQIWLVCNGKHISTSKAILDHNERDTSEEENQETQNSTFVEEYDECLQFVTPPNEPEDEINNDEEEAQILKQDISESSITHNMAKKEAADAALLAQVEEFKRKLSKLSQDYLSQVKEMEKLRRKLTKAMEEARLAKERTTTLEQIVAKLKEENSDVKREIQALRKPRRCTEFTLDDLKRATKNFSNKIGEGGYGPVYLGLLRHTPVAIKMLNPKSNQGHAEYQQEVLVLSKIRHPNIVILIGFCSESSSLIYEYLPNGNVEERMARKRKNNPPLSWQDRIRIITEQRSVLIVLHSSKPHAIVHADLKLQNILLDEKNVSRLSDFGTARLIRSEEATICRQTTPVGTPGYMDPSFLTTGELTPQSDVYSFGVIILRLLTGLQVIKIAEQVDEGLRMGALRQLLDASAGEWPVVQTEKLLRLALKCCNIEPRRRPELVSEEWRTLEILSAMTGNQA